MEPNPGCSFDYVQILTGSTTERFCGRRVQFFNRGRIEAQGPVQMIFHSDSGEQMFGFRIRYEITPSGIYFNILFVTYSKRNHLMNDSDCY